MCVQQYLGPHGSLMAQAKTKEPATSNELGILPSHPSSPPSSLSVLHPATNPPPLHAPQNSLTMADKAVESATAAMEEVRLDENGQPLSKNALKKLLKAEAAAKKKAEKAAAKVRLPCLWYTPSILWHFT
jgi:hypothetical protein